MMKFKVINLIRLVIKNPFFSSSLVMVVGSNLYNLGQFVYHFLSGRFLGKVFYSDLAALISILGIVGIIQLAFGLTIVKYLSSHKEKKILADFIKWVYGWSVKIALAVSLLTLLFSHSLATFLNLQQPLSVYLLPPLLFFFIIATTGRSILQGLLRFNSYVTSLIAESAVKIILAIIFILLGYALLGTVAALVLSVVAAFLIVRYSVADYLRGGIDKKPNILPLLKYSFFVFIQGLALTSMYSMDLLLVKHFFPPEEAGIYASLAVLGRVVFFGASPITHVMFPVIARKHHLGEGYIKIFYLSLLLVTGFSLIVLLFYLFFPQLAIGLLYGTAYLVGSPILWWFALFMAFLAVAMLITQFYLSIGKTKIILLFLIAAIAQIALIWFIHPDLLTVIQLSILTAALLDLCLIVYFFYLYFSKK
ncbi:MAG: oligosaccharide flippase family protein [Candidatus Daviesbacteria bacterium]|nr:MAG: oligosaccharide flippase family protein [Candidatus Daviesbacteria bacterium]